MAMAIAMAMAMAFRLSATMDIIPNTNSARFVKRPTAQVLEACDATVRGEPLLGQDVGKIE